MPDAIKRAQKWPHDLSMVMGVVSILRSIVALRFEADIFSFNSQPEAYYATRKGDYQKIVSDSDATSRRSVPCASVAGSTFAKEVPVASALLLVNEILFCPSIILSCKFPRQ